MTSINIVIFLHDTKPKLVKQGSHVFLELGGETGLNNASVHFDTMPDLVDFAHELLRLAEMPVKATVIGANIADDSWEAIQS